jgi:hypothetical protein
MRSNKRIPPMSVLIACEGTATEYAYFERLKEEIEEDGRWAITVYPDRDAPDDQNPKTSALQLVRLAKERSADYDIVWVVFDKDGYSLHQEAFALAKSEKLGKPLNIAFSSIAFEYWVLAHFERNANGFLKSECRVGKKPRGCGTALAAADCAGMLCVCGRLRTQNFLSAYGKQADYDLYPKVRHLIPTALINAAWLRHQQRKRDSPIFDLNPYTDVDVLIKKLLNIEDQIIWASLFEWFRFQGLAYHLDRLDETYRLTVQNQGGIAIVLNQIACYKFESDEQTTLIPLENRLLTPGEHFTFEYQHRDPSGRLPALKIKHLSTAILFENGNSEIVG